MTDRTTARILSSAEALPVASALPGSWTGRIALLSEALTRQEAGAPICASSPPDDLQLFEDPTDATVKYWLPRYSLAQDEVSGQQRYRLALAEADGGTWKLTLRLARAAPPGLEEAALSQPVLPHTVEVELSYGVLGAPQSRKIMPFQERTALEDGSIDAVLTLATLGQRDEVYQALRDAGRGALLLVRRVARVAVEDAAPRGMARAATGTLRPDVVLRPGGVLRPNGGPIIQRPPRPDDGPIIFHPRPDEGPIFQPPRPQLPTPALAFVRAERNDRFKRFWLSVTNWQDFAPEYFAASPDLPPCGANTNASRSWVDIFDAVANTRIYGFCALGRPEDLTQLWFAVEVGTPAPDQVNIVITDRRANVTAASNPVSLRDATPPEPVYRVIEAQIEQTVEPSPFAFSPVLHGYIFQGVDVGGTGGTTTQGGLLRHREVFNGTVHSYFQDARELQRIFFLPDGFWVTRRPRDSHGIRNPFMTLRVQTVNGSTQGATANLDYVVTQTTDPARLATVRAALAAGDGLDPATLVFQPYLTSGVRFFIQRPGAAGRVDEERPAGALMLQGPLFDTLVMPLADFQLCFDAMLGRSASRFGGRVEIDVDGWGTEIRPFVADFSALAGSALDLAPTEAEGGLSIQVRNAIESPVSIGELVLSATRAGETVEVHAVGADTETVLASSAQAEFRAPAPGLAGTGAIVLTDPSGVRVEPDDAAVLNAILSRDTLDYYRDITVKAAPVLFQPIPDRPDDQILSILVDFEGSSTVELNAATLVQVARIYYPFDGVILRHAVDTHYRFSKRVVRADGRQDRDPAPTEQDDGTFFVEVVR